MTLANSCHASNMMHVMDKSTYRVIATTKAFRIAMFQRSIVVIWKNESHFET